MGAFYLNSIDKFLDDDNTLVIGLLTAAQSTFHQLLNAQTRSWSDEIDVLKEALKKAVLNDPKIGEYGILLEYPIARREKRIDVVIIAGGIMVIIEFKVGKAEYLISDKEQVIDYCLDLRDFHFESRDKIIVPILLATHGKAIDNIGTDSSSLVKNIMYANSNNLADILADTFLRYNDKLETIDYNRWNDSDYSPTPTIIEAAQALYAGKSVIEISQSHARGKNLTDTTAAVIDAIRVAKAENQKIICFITGVPGAGKTLAGLNIAHHKEFQRTGESLATFLSGNMPLITVLREALTRDAFKKIQKRDSSSRKKETARIISFIENAHRFFEPYYFDKKGPNKNKPNKKIPNNKIVIFDEAQRAWDAEQSKKKFDRPSSEADMMFEIMDRHKDWAAIVALIGGGQEINTGEAGLPEWGRVIEEKYSDWKVYISPQLLSGDHSTGNSTLFKKIPTNVSIIENPNLHLTVSIRSYKAEDLSNWVGLVLLNEPTIAKQLFVDKLSKYKIVVTRDLNKAKQWLKSNCEGSRRMGLVSSSGARRLRPYGLEVKMPFEEKQWFLNGRNDIRSSYYLEVPATEFKIQGLELDWIGVCWDADLRRINNQWDFKFFNGTNWQRVKKHEMQKFIINKYRVLLTRAREGMVIFIPPGSEDDYTRLPEFYNSVASYLVSCGVVEI